MKVKENTNDDDKYKERNLQHQDVNETVINKTKEEEALIKRLIYMNFKQNFIHFCAEYNVTKCWYVMDNLNT